jgi:peptide/nickel transport system ATP-binding protein
LEVSFQNQSVPAVAGISYSIFPGEIVAIAGESGSGKSLTALSINQLLPKNAHVKGTIRFNGNEIYPKPSVQIKRGKDTGNIFQDPMLALNPFFTCGNQLKEAIQRYQAVPNITAKKIALEWLKRVELTDTENIYHRYPHQLSGGQQQRIMIAMAMCNQPQLLIADEPTTALDASLQKNILQLIARLSRENNTAVLLISHDLNLIANFANRTIIMQKGIIVEQGKTESVIQKPQHAYTKALLASRPTLQSKPFSLPDPENELPKPLEPFKPQPEILLEINELLKQYISNNAWRTKTQKHIAVDHVSFTLHKNEMLGIMGESGSGKSTLGNMIMHFTEITDGQIFFEGKDITHAKGTSLKKLRSKMQMVFQNPYASLNPQMNVYDTLEEPLIISGINNQSERRLRIEELIHDVQLQPDILTRYPHQLSGGQRQRIAIARALANNPALLIFDESVAALDVRIQASVLNLINTLRRKKSFSALFISHDLAVIHYLCDRVLVMEMGRVAEIGSVQEVFEKSQNPYTQKLLQAVFETTELL